MKGLMKCMAWALVFVGVLALAPIGPWWLEYFRHFLVQIALCSGVFAILFATRKQWRWVVAFLVLGGVQMGLVAESLRGPEHVVAQEGDLKLISANVLTSNPDAQALLDWVRQEDPDLLMLLEVNATWLEKLAPLQTQFPYREDHPRGDNFGISLWSRIPMEANSDWIGEAQIPSIHATFQGEHPFALFAVHPLPPMNRAMVNSRNRQLHALGELVMASELPVLVAGDMNTTPWSLSLSEFKAQTNLHPARTSWVSTWPVAMPFLGIQIDHVLVSESIGVVSCERGPDIGSDHWPLLTRFRVEEQSPLPER
jgi:endonuclease/exonuclease/phosphatase (EEP) superfamily protein YafD